MKKIKNLAALVLTSFVYLAATAPLANAASTDYDSSYSKRFNFSLLGGVAFTRPDSDLSDSWTHETDKSPVVAGTFQFSFLSQHTCNLLVGAQVIYFHSVEDISSESATSSLATDEVIIEPTIGLGINLGGVQSRARLMFNLGLGERTRETKLDSPGFSVTIKQHHDTDFHVSGSGQFLYSLTDNWRITGALFLTTDSDFITAGVSYGF